MKIKKKYKGILWGIVIIVAAVLFLLNGLGVFDSLNLSLSFTQIAWTIIFGVVLVNSIVDLSFIGMFLSASVIVHLYRDALQIPDTLSSWTLIIAGTLIGVGLDIIFKNSKKQIKKKHHKKPKFNISYSFDDDDENESKQDSDDDVVYTNSYSDNNVTIENSFGERTDYISSQNFQSATLDNGFGNLTVYFDGTQITNGAAVISVDNGFGNTNLYLPASWKLNMKEDSGFGKVLVHGMPSNEKDAPIIHINVDNGFGHVDIYFN